MTDDPATTFPGPRFVETNGIRMAVYEQGEGAPVILLHGFPELAYSWRHQFPALAAAGFRAIAPDQRGYGDADPTAKIDATRGMRDFVEDGLALMDHLGHERFHLVGNSLGGAIGLVLGLFTRFWAFSLIVLSVVAISFESVVQRNPATNGGRAGSCRTELHFPNFSRDGPRAKARVRDGGKPRL